MGMAASQARYLALSARKTNVEYEGQQINQQRLVLSNQSADLFNQMLTMSVPLCPDSSEFSKLQYSWNDGINTSVLESYYQIGQPNEDFNYVVTSYHYEDVYTGQRKYLNDPQIQATKTNNFSDKKNTTYTVRGITYDKDNDIFTLKLEDGFNQEGVVKLKRSLQNENSDVVEQLDYMYGRTAKVDVTPGGADANPATYANNAWKFAEAIIIEIANPDFDPTQPIDATNQETKKVTIPAGTEFTELDMEDPEVVSALRSSYGDKLDMANKYYSTKVGNDTFYICGDDINLAQESLTGTIDVRVQDKKVYYTDGKNYIPNTWLAKAKVGSTLVLQSAVNNPVFSNYKAVGNCELTSLTTEAYEQDATIDAEIQQLLKDLSKDPADKISYERLKACFDENGKYINGSLYQFTMGGKTYYTTAPDLDESLLSAYEEKATADNGIDSQHSKLAYYNSIYINTKITEVKKALLETDGQGRFSTVKFEDDSVVYSLNVEKITDEDAYNDAMNRYYYEQEQYDKKVSDINAKTEVLQAQDRRLQLKLEQLNTEQTALQTEMEACQKVVSKNIEGSFKTFGG